jgi:PAS domain S-box-containing protein
MGRTPKAVWRVAASILLLALVYVAAGKLSLALATVHPSASAVWPPTGISLAALLALGTHVCPGIFLGAFVVNISTAGTIATCLAIALGNTLEALVGAGLVQRFANGIRAFDRPKDVFKFVVLAGLASTTISATVGVSSLCLSGTDWSRYFPIWLTWWLGDAVGALLVAPPLLLWWADPHVRWTRSEAVKGTGLLLALGGLSALVLETEIRTGIIFPPRFTFLPVMVLVAFQFGPRETASAMLVLSGLALWATLHHYGGQHESLLLLQVFLGITAMTVLALAAVVSQHRRAEKELQTANENLEQRVHERTIRLAQVNETLRERIAQRNQAEKAVMEHEERTQRILDTAYDAFIAMNAGGLIVEWNAQAEATFGWQRHEVVDQPLAERIIPPRFRDDHRGGLARYLVKGDSHIMNRRVEMTALHRDGHEFPVEMRIWPTYAGEGHQFNAFVHDITERKRALAQLRESEQRFRLLVDNVKDYAILLMSPEGIVSSWNAGAQRIKGYLAEEIVGRHFSCLFLPEDIARGIPQEELRRAAADGRSEHEGWRLRKDGSRFWADIIITSLVDESGKLRGFVKITRDVTARREAEAKLRRSERLAAIGEMVAGLAHESRNALQLSQACLELLGCKLDGQPDLQGLVQDIQKSHDHLHRLYEEVRSYAAPLKLERRRCDLSEILQETWDQLIFLHQGRSALMNQKTGGLDLCCDVDRLAMGQVFRNILENSLHASPDPVEIWANWSEAHRNGHCQIQVSVRDNGPGMTPETRQRLFEPFFTTRTQGTGLGMAIAKRIVEAHDGQISVADESGPGTEIQVMLPRSST